MGSWSFIDPDNPATLIVYQFAEGRRMSEQHYYLNSATPKIPRLTMRGQWRIEADGRMVIEPRSGFGYAVDSISRFIGEYADNGREAWARPVPTRFYWINSATKLGIHVNCSRSGISDQIQFTMKPYGGL